MTPQESTNATGQREGMLVTPRRRLSDDQVRLIDGVSRDLLADPGLLCFNKQATELFREAGAKVEPEEGCARVRLTPQIIDRAIKTAPSTVVLGAREPDNRLVLNAHEPRVRFGSGSETNIWLEVDFDGDVPRFTRTPGSIQRLCEAACLGDRLENLDFFIRCVNIQDEDVTSSNKDVNKFAASLAHITKHVQAGLTDLAALDDVIKLGQIVAGGEDAFASAPVLSFIACVIKSPFQVVDDTADKAIEIARRGIPLVISSCPMGGATGPFDEFGMVAQVNAEVLAGVALLQLANPGAPALYGAVPTRTRLDNLNDMYGAPEACHYHQDLAQMARHYGLPCYATAGVADADTPGIQATAEKLAAVFSVPQAGAQYIHYAFGLLERTNVFCPEQAVLDNAHIGLAKRLLADPNVVEGERDRVLADAREIMATDHKTYIYHLPIPSRENVYAHYPLESDQGGALRAAHDRVAELLAEEPRWLPEAVQRDIAAVVPGVLPRAMSFRKEPASR